MPARSSSSRSPRSPSDVIITSSTSAIIGSRLIAQASIEPVHLGHLPVEDRQLEGVAVARPPRAAPRAPRRRPTARVVDAPPGELVVQDCAGWSRCRRRPARAGRAAALPAPPHARLAAAASRTGAGEPERRALPSVLRTPISPPISVTSRLEIARPRPVPPYLRVVEPSACVKAWNSRVCAAGGMPMPVSCTSKRSRTSSGRLLAERGAHRPPRRRSVNLIALPTRLVSTWRSRPGSPRRRRRHVVLDQRGQLDALGGRLFGEQVERCSRPPGAGRSRSSRSAACPPRSSRSRGCR